MHYASKPFCFAVLESAPYIELQARLVESKMADVIKKINSKHRQLMMELIAGAKMKDAAARVGFSVEHAYIISTTDLFKECKAELEKDVRANFVESEGTKHSREWFKEQVNEGLPAAVATIRALSESADNESVRLKGASEIIAMAGMKQAELVEAKITIDAPDGLMSMLRRAAEEDKKDD